MQRIENLSADLSYLLYLPDDINAQDEWQLILFLHGKGERGTDLSVVNKWGVPKYLDAGNDLNAIVYAPQCPESTEIWVPMLDKVIAGLDAIQSEYNISQTHITGFSMGGHGTHYLAVKHPERFVSVSPVAGRMYKSHDVTDEMCVLKEKRVWVFHSVADYVPVEDSDKVVEKLRACGAEQVFYTRYDDADHTETSDLVYFNQEFYEWMLT
ncbi:MAG: alpha/beta hydrolase-fold protein [Chloroflexota bacterium]